MGWTASASGATSAIRIALSASWSPAQKGSRSIAVTRGCQRGSTPKRSSGIRAQAFRQRVRKSGQRSCEKATKPALT